MTVERLLGEIGSRELTEWEAFDRVHPFGEERADLRAAIMPTVFVNAFAKPGRPMAKPIDFMPVVQSAGRSKRMTTEQMKHVLARLTAVMGGTTRSRGS